MIDYLKRQNLADIGTFFIGIAACFALYSSKGIIEKLLKIEIISNRIESTSRDIKIAVDLMAEQLKIKSAGQIADSLKRESKTSKKIEVLVAQLSKIPIDMKSTTAARPIYLPKSARETLLKEYRMKPASFDVSGYLAQNLAFNLSRFGHPQTKSIVINLKFGTMSQLKGEWVDSVERLGRTCASAFGASGRVGELALLFKSGGGTTSTRL